MKILPRLFLLLGLLGSGTWAAPLQKAEVTRVHQDVKILPAAGDSREAKPGDVVEGRTAVRTGDKSRAELKFTDETLTRLGANTQFSFESGTRNLSLENGVIFLQVPKGAGGAQIRTAAVTAAVTGTTIMMEYVNGKVLKIIVVEGTLDVFFPDRPGVFTTLRAGQMIMMRPDALGFPRPVEVDIDKLLETSDLAGDGKVFDPVGGDAGEAINQAVNQQNKDLQDGKLIGTNLVIPGRGNQVLVLPGDAALALRADGAFLSQGPPPGQRPPPPRKPLRPLPPGDQFSPPPLLAGNWIIDGTMNLNPNPEGPRVNQLARSGDGAVYLPGATGPLHPWLFGTLETVPGNDLADILDGTGPWSVYLLQNVQLSGTPVVAPSGTPNLMIASPNSINTPSPALPGSTQQWNLAGAQNWALMTQGGSINLTDTGFLVSGTTSNLLLHANGLTADIKVMNNFDLGEGKLATLAGRDTSYENGANIEANSWSANTAGKLAVVNTTARVAGGIKLEAGGDIEIDKSDLQSGPDLDDGDGNVAAIAVQDSSQLAALANASGDGGNVLIRSRNGNIRLSGNTRVRANNSGEFIDVIALNGRVDISGNSQLEQSVGLSADSVVNIQASGGTNPGIRLETMFIDANDIIVQASGADTMLEITNSDIVANNSARLYAEGPGSVLQLGGYTYLTGQTVRLAGETVRVVPQGYVDATTVGRLGIHADKHEYSLNNTSSSQWGTIATGSETLVIQTNYAGRNGPLNPPPSQ